MTSNEKFILEVKDKKLPVFIYGNGEVGQLSKRKIEKMGGQVNGFVVDNVEPFMKDTYSITEVKTGYQEFVIIKGFLKALYMPDNQIKEKFGERCKGVYSINAMYDSVFTEEISDEYFKENKQDFERVKNGLYNQESKQVFDIFLKAKTEQNDTLLLPIVQPTQYFFDDPCWELSEHEVLVDGGAYDGDSIADFCKRVNACYDKIYALEPDKSNAEKLKNRIEKNNWSNIEVIEKGLSKNPGVLQFDAKGNMMSTISESGTTALEVDSIDNILDGKKATIIKMDIEGSEMNALYGAENTIKRWKPMLFISAYHKKHDLIDIYDYVNSISDAYEWFFYAHKPLAIDAVLYAIPKHRIKC